MPQLFVVEIQRYPTPKSRYERLYSTEKAAPALAYWQRVQPVKGYRARLKRNGRTIGRKGQ